MRYKDVRMSFEAIYPELVPALASTNSMRELKIVLKTRETLMKNFGWGPTAGFNDITPPEKLYDVVLTSNPAYPASRLGVIKVIREVSGLSLKESKEISDRTIYDGDGAINSSGTKAARTIKSRISYEECVNIQRKIRGVGGDADIFKSETP